MKYELPEISWHDRNAILSVDFQPNCNGKFRLATSDTLHNIRLWELTERKQEKKSGVNVEYLAQLQFHERAVNTVRFSPNGEFLASGDSNAVIAVWEKSPPSNAPDIFGSSSDSSDLPPNLENWSVKKKLRKHIDEVTDLSWSKDSKFIASVSVDKTCVIWNVETGKALNSVTFPAFPNGVCWDPMGQVLAALGNDRMLHILTSKKCNRIKKIRKAKLFSNQTAILKPGGDEKKESLSKENGSNAKETDDSQFLFHSDSLMSYVRKPTFSPCGRLLFAPAGQYLNKDSGKLVNCSYIFLRSALDKPCLVLPCPNTKPTIVIRTCPQLFELDQTKSNDMLKLPYRLVYGVLTQESIIVYHSQSSMPIAHISDIHFCPMTDFTWSDDGRMIIASSEDGYCSIVTFGVDELGQKWEGGKVETVVPEQYHSLLPTPSRRSKAKDSQPAVANNSQTPSAAAAVTKASKEMNPLSSDPSSNNLPAGEATTPKSSKETSSNIAAKSITPIMKHAKPVSPLLSSSTKSAEKCSKSTNDKLLSDVKMTSIRDDNSITPKREMSNKQCVGIASYFQKGSAKKGATGVEDDMDCQVIESPISSSSKTGRGTEEVKTPKRAQIETITEKVNSEEQDNSMHAFETTEVPDLATSFANLKNNNNPCSSSSPHPENSFVSNSATASTSSNATPSAANSASASLTPRSVNDKKPKRRVVFTTLARP